jgi:carbonic anhydrase/acetyltransferase-like protein (isoleucine patch superfamily)
MTMGAGPGRGRRAGGSTPTAARRRRARAAPGGRVRPGGEPAARDGAIPFGGHRPRIHPSAFVTQGTYVVGRVTVGPRASIWFGAVLRGDIEPIRIGEESLIEDNVVLHGRVVVGRRCVIGHGAILHGCTIGDGAVVGASAVVFDGARVGAGALVAAGSVVYPRTRVPPRSIFRNSAAGNHPSIAPVGGRLRRWPATSYRAIVTTYRAGGVGARVPGGGNGGPPGPGRRAGRGTPPSPAAAARPRRKRR